MYKLKKISHLNQFKEKNYFKPMCCIIISNKLQKNIDFYKILKSTLISLQNDKNYISIYLINSDEFEDEHKTFNDLDKEKPYFLMFFRSIQYEFFSNPINEFIPNIVSKICSINDGYLANISKALTTKDKKLQSDTLEPSIIKLDHVSEIKLENKSNTKLENKSDTKINKKNKNKKENIVEKSEEYAESGESNTSSEESQDSEIIKKLKVLKQKQKLLKEIDE